MPFVIPYTKLAIAIAIAVALAGTHYKAYHSGAKSVEAKWNEEKLELANQAIEMVQLAAAKTTQAQAEADKLRSTKNAQIASLNTALANAVAGLRNRPDRPTDSDLSKAANSGPSAGCTGASLFAQDASIALGEAARADRLLLDLDQCQAAHLAAREALK